jgi:hypothetical protein
LQRAEVLEYVPGEHFGDGMRFKVEDEIEDAAPGLEVLAW